MYLDSDPRSVLGRRICIYGWGGKTALEREIGAALELQSAREQRDFQEWLERGALPD